MVCSSRGLLARVHLPASLRSTPVTALPGYDEGSNFPPAASLHSRISLIHAARASDRSASKHLMTFRGLLSYARQRRGLSLRTVSRLRPPGLRLRHWAAGSPDHPVESSSSRADRSFVFRCSPPRLTATQLRSTMVNERLTRRDFHSSARACFQAHGPAAELPSCLA